MKYKTLRFTLVSLLMMVCGTVFADESPEVTFDFTGQTDWKIPTSGTNKDLATFTAGNYSIKLYSTDNYKQNSGYLILGKANSYLEFPAFDFAVSKIVVTGKNGASGSVGQNIYVGENAVSTATTGATGTNTYEIASGNQAAGTIYKLMVTSAHNTQITKIEVYKATVSTVATPAITPNGGSFIGTQSVTLSCDTEGATIYYTLDGSEPTAQSTQYAGTAFEITGTTTVKAIAIKGDDKSSVASATFTAIPSFATIAAMSALANNAVFAFTGEALIVAKPTAKHVFIKDETGSALVYDNSGELTEAAAVGKTIAANWTGKVSIYKNLFELVPDKAIAVKDGDAVSVSYPEVTVADLTAENVNKVVTLKGITSYTVDGKNIAIKIGETDVVGYNQFGLEIAAAEEGKTYQMVGAISRYNDNIQFQPIEIKEETATPEPQPEPSWIAPTIAGEDPVTDGQYKVMNVGSGKYLAMGKAWFSWATTAIVAEDGFVAKFAGDAASFTLTNTGNGKYVFTSGNDIQGDAMHADGANATNYGLTKLANGNYHIHDVGGNAESPCWGYNSDFHATGIVAHADATSAGWNCEWIFVGDNAANLYNAKLALYNALVRAAENGVDTDEASAVYAKADATVDELKAAADKLTHATNFAVNTANAVEGADMTYTIVNPSFETGNTNGWTYEASNDHGAKENSNGTYTMANCDGKYLFNIWSSGNLISQTIEDLPNGTYKMKAIIATDADHKVQLNANDKSVQIDAIGKETGVEGELEFDVFNNKATIGAEGVNKYWYKVDNFRLTYVKGIDLSELVTTYETALANAQAVEGIMNAEVKTALETAITANSEVDKTDFNALTDAVKALTDATNAANASIAAYTNAKAAIDAAKAEMAATNVYTAEALEAYKAVYDAAESKYENRTLTDDEAKALENPKALTGWHEANIVDNLLLSAWDAEADKFEGYYINSWSTEGEIDGSEFKVPFFEYWVSDDNSLGEKTLTATMNNLEAGEYDVTAWVRVRIKNGAEAPAAGITLQANDGEAVNVAAGDQVGTSQMYLKEFTATGTVAEDSILKIKFNIAADNNISWLSFKNVKFEKKPVEVAHTWDFTQWSEATVTNLKADAAASKLEGWSDVEKKADAEADGEPTEASKDNCFWATVTPDENGELSANDVVIEELKGLAFNSTYSTARSLAIAVNYPVALSTYAGPAYLWLGGGGKNVDCFVIKNVKAGTQIKMGVESHNTSDARGVQLFVEGAEGARGAKLTAPDGSDVAVPSVYEEQTWAVPGEDGVCNIIVYNTKGCHIYFIDAEIGETTPVIAEDPELVAPEEWTSVITNGNLATEDVTNYISKEAPSTDMIGATIVAGAGKNGSRGIVVKSAERTLTGEKDDQGNDKWTGQDWDTQFFIKLNETLPVGTKLHVEFDYKADKAALANTQAHGEPGGYKHWACIGDVNFTADWQKFSKDIEIDANMADMQTIAFNLAVEKTPTEYCFDNFGIWIQKPAPVNEWANLIVNSDMEGDDASCFYVTEQSIGGPFVAELTNGIGKDGGKAVKVQSGNNPAQAWDTQFFIRLPYQLPANTKYRVSFDYKATEAAKATTQAHGEPGAYIHYIGIGDVNFTAEWQPFSLESVVSADQSKADNPMQTIAFNLAELKTANLYIFDNVKFEVPADVVATLTANPAVNPTYYKDYVETGIASLKNSMDAKTIFNLNGQKMNKAQKGLYIINGKKVVIK